MTWLPGIVVLAAGLLVGMLVSRRLRGDREPDQARNLELELADLEQRRDDLYRRLGDIEQGLAPTSDRADLETAAARTLQQLESLGATLKKRHPKIARERRPKTDETPAPPSSAGRVFLTGFAYGAGLLLLIGGLVYWAVRDAQPRPDDGGPMFQSGAAERTEAPHPGADELPPQVAERVAAISQHLETQPDDLDARKELGYTYLGASRFVEAFREGEEILARQPDDPDGLYLTAVVRLTMGQVEIAEQLLARALESDPAHTDSLTAAGVIRLRLGDYGQAIALWKRGLAATGGQQPMIERMISLAEQGRSPEEILNIGTPQSTPAEAPAASPPAPPQPSAGSLTIALDLAPGATPPPGATLFVIFRGPGEGPPAAVKRINRPAFPMTVTLSQADSMLGRPLPDAGTVSARLDRDGSASTRDAMDLAASATVSMGEALSLELETDG